MHKEKEMEILKKIKMINILSPVLNKEIVVGLISRKRLRSGSLCGQGIKRIIPKSLMLVMKC
jgi:hypothetical protein